MYSNKGIRWIYYADFPWQIIKFSKKLKNKKILSMYFFFIRIIFFCIRICIQYRNVAINMHDHFEFRYIFSFNYFFNYRKSIHLN